MDLKNNNSEEVNINDLLGRFSKILNKLGLKIYLLLKLLYKNKIILSFCLFICFSLGYAIDYFYKKNSFNHEFIVTANVDSQTFLYKEINNLKFDQNNSLKSSEIEPIVDIFNFMSKNENNLEVAKFLADNNVKLIKHNKGNETEQVYHYHIVKFKSNNYVKAEKEIDSIMHKLNNEKYFKDRLASNYAHIETKIKENNISINNINKLFEKLGTNQNNPNSNVNIEVFTEINKLIENKQYLLEENNELKKDLIENKNVIFKIADIESNKESIDSKYKFILPIIFILGLFLIISIKTFIKKYKSSAV